MREKIKKNYDLKYRKNHTGAYYRKIQKYTLKISVLNY